MYRTNGGTLEQTVVSPAQVRLAAFSPTGARVAFQLADNSLIVWDRTASSPQTIDAPVAQPAREMHFTNENLVSLTFTGQSGVSFAIP